MRLWPSVSIVFVIVAVGFLTLYLRTSEGPAIESERVELPAITNVSYEDDYSAGVHEITGTATVPTKCLTLTTAAALVDGTPPVIRIDLTAAPDEGICLSLPAEREFTIDIEAPQDALIDIYGNGVLLTTTKL